MKKLLFIYNPHAGKGKIVPQVASVTECFQRSGYLPTIYATQGKGDGVWAASALAGGYDHIVCSGGDGTLSEVVTGLYKNGWDKPLGYIPTGTTNDYSKTLCLPLEDAIAAADMAVNGYPQRCDVGEVNGEHLFTYVAAFGVFTETSYATPQYMKNVFGHAAYVLEGIKSLANLKHYHMKVEWDDGEMEDDFIYGMVSNSVSVGGFEGICGDQVVLDDGVFEIMLVKPPKSLADLNQLGAALLSRIPNESIIALRAHKITFTAEEEISWTLDGEFGGAYRTTTVENKQEQITIMSGREPDDHAAL